MLELEMLTRQKVCRRQIMSYVHNYFIIETWMNKSWMNVDNLDTNPIRACHAPVVDCDKLRFYQVGFENHYICGIITTFRMFFSYSLPCYGSLDYYILATDSFFNNKI